MEEGSDYWTPEKVANIINELNEKYKNGYEIYCTGDWFRLIDRTFYNFTSFEDNFFLSCIIFTVHLLPSLL